MGEAGRGPDEELDSFVGRFLVSFAAWDLLVLLHSQQGLQDTIPHLAYRLGRAEADVARALAVMAEGGVVLTEDADGDVLYGLSPDWLPVLQRFSAACEDREWRLERVRGVLSRMARP